MKVLLLLSGPSAVGKTVISTTLTEKHAFSKVATSPHLRSIAGSRSLPASKGVLQEIGDELDSATNFAWVVDEVAKPRFEQAPEVTRWLVDSVRKREQVVAFRSSFGLRALHVHLTAPEHVLRKRYESREQGSGGDFTPYDEVVSHQNEVAARSLIAISDLSLDVNELSHERVIQTILDECHKRGM